MGKQTLQGGCSVAAFKEQGRILYTRRAADDKQAKDYCPRTELMLHEGASQRRGRFFSLGT
jgi:hypothetical protein